MAVRLGTKGNWRCLRSQVNTEHNVERTAMLLVARGPWLLRELDERNHKGD